MTTFSFSFLLPTRGRPELVQRFFQSIVDTTSQLNKIEIILAVDDDDLPSQAISDNQLNLKKVIIPRGATMGALNRACFEASSGRYVMLINDDVVIRTKNWDNIISGTWGRYPDDIALLHVNDLLFRDGLCTFPMLSRKACLSIGVCPAEYQRYRIDDHIYDTYNMLAHIGHKRIIYLEEVVFEHENYEEQVTNQTKNNTAQLFESVDKKVYLPNQDIINRDIQFFETARDQRKQDALTLANLIDQHQREQRQAVYQSLLGGVHDTYSYRQSNYVTKVLTTPDESVDIPATVTIAVVTSDIYKPHAQKCLSYLKKHTANFDLIILDNNNSSNFNHPREMNKVLQSVKTDFLVLLDDDVYVEAGWLEGLLKCVDAETGIVTPLHKDKHGRLSYSGVYLKGDGLGTHAHTLDKPAQPRVTQCICSAAVLIDLKKCGHILFNPAYRKYFLDLDYSLQVWEAGYKVICTPEATVTHLGGGTMPYYSLQSQELNQQDVTTFIDIWVNSGRLAAIEEKTWSKFEYLQFLLTIPKEINQFFETADHLAFDQFKQKLEKLLVIIQPFNLFGDLLIHRLQLYTSTSRSRGDSTRTEYCEEIVKELTRESLWNHIRRVPKKLMRLIIKGLSAYPKSRQLTLTTKKKLKWAFENYQRLPRPIRNLLDAPVFRLKNGYEELIVAQFPLQPSNNTSTNNNNSLSPKLLGAFEGYNVVAYNNCFYGLPLSLGHIDLKQESGRNLPGIIVADSVNEVKAAIKKIILSTPRLIGTYKGYNLVLYEEYAYGLPISSGHIDITKAKNQNLAETIKATTLLSLKKSIDQIVTKNYSIILIREGLRYVRAGKPRTLLRFMADTLRLQKRLYEAQQEEITNDAESLGTKTEQNFLASENKISPKIPNSRDGNIANLAGDNPND